MLVRKMTHHHAILTWFRIVNLTSVSFRILKTWRHFRIWDYSWKTWCHSDTYFTFMTIGSALKSYWRSLEDLGIVSLFLVFWNFTMICVPFKFYSLGHLMGLFKLETHFQQLWEIILYYGYDNLSFHFHICLFLKFL